MIEVPALEKRAGDARVFHFDFSDFAEFKGAGAEAVATAAVTAVPPGLTVGTPTPSGAKVLVRVSGGAPGRCYLLTCDLTTSGGARIVRSVRLDVLP